MEDRQVSKEEVILHWVQLKMRGYEKDFVKEGIWND